MFKFDTHLSLSRLFGAQIDHTADKLFHSLHILDSEKLAHFHSQRQLYKRSVRVHDQRMGLFRGYVGSGAFSEHHDRQSEAHTLTST